MFQIKENLNFTDKLWFIIIENRQEGPFSLKDLKQDKRFTPDTLVWKKGFKEWVSARFVPEIQELFKDDLKSQTLPPSSTSDSAEAELCQEKTLTFQQDPYQLFLWILVLLLIFFYTFYQFYYQ